MRKVLKKCFPVSHHVPVFICCALPVFLGIFFVYFLGVNVPYWDEWIIVPLLKKFFAHTLTVADLLNPHIEHRMFFPRILILFVVSVTDDYNSTVFMYISQLFFGLILTVLYLEVKQRFHFTLRTLPVWFIPIPFLVFSWRQWENLLSGFQVTYIMSLLFSVISLYCLHKANGMDKTGLDRTTLVYFMASILSAVIASFSMIMGLFVWAAGICLFVSPGCDVKKLCLTVAWAITGFAVWILYFTGSSNHFWLNTSGEGIKTVVWFTHFLILLGMSLCIGTNARVLGAVLLVVFALVLSVLIKQKRIQENVFWISLASYSLFVLMAISIGRSHFGTEGILMSRYSTCAIPFIIALYMLAVAIVKNIRFSEKSVWNRFLLWSAGIALIGGVGMSYASGFNAGIELFHIRKQAVLTLLHYQKASEKELVQLYPDPDFLIEQADHLKEWEYGVFNTNYLKKNFLVKDEIHPCLASDQLYFHSGWSEAEKWGRWGVSNESAIIFMLPELRSFEMSISIRSAPLIDKEQEIDVMINEFFLERFVIPEGRWSLITFHAPQSALTGKLERVTFVSKHAISPFDQHINPDTRRLSIGINHIEFRW